MFLYKGTKKQIKKKSLSFSLYVFLFRFLQYWSITGKFVVLLHTISSLSWLIYKQGFYSSWSFRLVLSQLSIKERIFCLKFHCLIGCPIRLYHRSPINLLILHLFLPCKGCSVQFDVYSRCFAQFNAYLVCCSDLLDMLDVMLGLMFIWCAEVICLI